MIRGKLNWNWLKFYGERNTGSPAITAPRLQTMRQTLTTSKQSIEFTFSDFPCHFKVNSDKPALTFRWWKRKTGKRLTITANVLERNLGTALSGKKNPARGRYSKKLNRSRARDKPIRFEDLGIRPAQMLEKKIKEDSLTMTSSFQYIWPYNQIRGSHFVSKIIPLAWVRLEKLELELSKSSHLNRLIYILTLSFTILTAQSSVTRWV